MTRPLVEQRRLRHRGREFHFVSYAGQPATPLAWWLMSAGRRWEVMPFQAGLDAAEVDRTLAAWLDAHVFLSPNESGG